MLGGFLANPVVYYNHVCCSTEKIPTSCHLGSKHSETYSIFEHADFDTLVSDQWIKEFALLFFAKYLRMLSVQQEVHTVR